MNHFCILSKNICFVCVKETSLLQNRMFDRKRSDLNLFGGFYLLLSPYLCFISLLYLDLYVLGDDALIS